MNLSNSDWIALVGVVIALLTMIGGMGSIIVTVSIYAGKILSKLDNVIERFEAHEKKDERRFESGDLRMNSHSENLVALNQKVGMDIERTHQAMDLRMQTP